MVLIRRRGAADIGEQLFHSNLSGYLKIAVSPGDLFLLGLFSSPAQVALYGLAKQLTAPLALLQTNIQTAITPEITSLMARRKLEQLKRLLNRYVASTLLIGGALLICAMLVGRVMIFWLFRPEYRAALPVFYVLLVVVWFMLVFIVFRPLALSLDLLRWYNLALLVNIAILCYLIITGRLNGLTMAYAQLAGALILRFFFNIPIWMRLRQLIASSSAEDTT